MDRLWTDFKESYHDHVCVIVTEKDVLDINIQGTSWVSSLKRWWYDLFLLSHSDSRSRLFYGSSHSARMERTKHFRLYRSSIHPLSKFRHFWDPLILVVIILNMALFYHSTSNLYGEFDWSFYSIAVVLELIIFVDIYFNLKTGYIKYDSRKIVLNSNKILLRYASTKLFAHVVSSLPLQCIMFLRYGRNISCSACKANKFIATLEILSVFRLYRLFDASSYWNKERRSFEVTYFFKFLRICVLGLATMLIIMNTADTFNLLTIIATGTIDDRSYFAIVFGIKHGHTKSLSNTMLISMEVARACKSFLLFSFSLKPSIYYLDKMASLLSYFVAMVFYLWSLVECYVCVGRLHFPEKQLVTNFESCTNLIKMQQLPDGFAKKVQNYYNFNMAKLYITETINRLYKNLPRSLKNEIALSSNMQLVIRIPYFSEWPMSLIQDIVLLLREECYLQGDLIAEVSSQSDGLIIIDVGVLGVYSISNQEKGHLIDGDYFSELSLVTDKEMRMSSVYALTSCKILFLGKYEFRKLMRGYPQFFVELTKQLTSKYISQNARNSRTLSFKPNLDNNLKMENTT